ncbi:MAG: LytTR family transcriptional regulator DNA-binding domain-containing protein [Marinilabiliaceae bacterium]|nr:LytTR family transcriptional regulator DNA-binding domain-containing protein [Marinilabiliaceae bacterium]
MKLIQISDEHKVAIKSNKGIRFLLLDEIVYVMAIDNYSKVVLAFNEEFLVPRTLKIVEKQLLPFTFIRCHKSFLVNVCYIKEMCCNNENKLILSTNKEVPVSREGLKKIKEAMGL